MKPEEVIDKQLDFYNKNLLDEFCSMYSDDIQIFNLTTGELMLSGKNALFEKYDIRFNIQNVKAKVIDRIVIGNTIIDHEEVTGIVKKGISKAVAIYEVKDDLITKVNFIFE